MFRLLLVVTLLLRLNTLAQIDSKRVDSLARVIDSSAKANRKEQESVIKFTDSNYQSDLNKALQQNSRDRDQFLAEKRRVEEKNRQKIIVRILLGVLLLLIAVIALAQWKKRKL